MFAPPSSKEEPHARAWGDGSCRDVAIGPGRGLREDEDLRVNGRGKVNPSRLSACQLYGELGQAIVCDEVDVNKKSPQRLGQGLCVEGVNPLVFYSRFRVCF